MPPFHFNLQSLLDARVRAEQAEQLAVAELERERLRLEDELRRRQADIAAGKGELRGGLTGRLDLRSLRLGAGSTLHVIRSARQLVLALAGVHQRIEAARARLLAATTRRRALELLRDRRYARWKARLDKAEAAALDELALNAAARPEDRP